ncbi:hypothetical protein GP486_006795, partial [Trichoglossum hirsutum]
EAEGEGGSDLMRTHYSCETGMYRFIPHHVPRPVAVGTYKSRPNVHFFLMEYVEMIDGDIPPPEPIIRPIVTLHRESLGKSPDGKFGSSVNSWFGHLVLPSVWEDSWEVWWTNHMKAVLAREETRRGPHTPEDKELVETYISKVLPRYLRPLETDGRSVTPCLVHTDLWPGNFKFKPDDETVIIFDSNTLWAHNERKPVLSTVVALFSNRRQ